MMEPSLPIWMYETMDAPEWQQGIINSLTIAIAIYLYMIDSDRRPLTSLSQTGVLSKL